MTNTMMIEYALFKETRLVKAHLHNMTRNETPDDVLWVERGEDMYALSSPGMKGKKVAIVYRNDWLKAKPVKSERKLTRELL